MIVVYTSLKGVKILNVFTNKVCLLYIIVVLTVVVLIVGLYHKHLNPLL
jgi:hypothetical protein